MRFRDRRDAGRQLARLLDDHEGERTVVLALPRGGVPVAYEVARRLHAPLDVFVVRKLGAPGNPEYAIGAVAPGGLRVVDGAAVRALGVTEQDLDEVTARERVELERRLRRYRGDVAVPDVRGKTVLLVDDGLATGSTATAAARALRRLGPERVVLAVPVAPPESVRRLGDEVDEVVAVATPSRFMAVGQWYDDFDATSDEEVVRLLEASRRVGPHVEHVRVPAGGVVLEGDLVVPPGARGVVLFAHGSGSGRFSPRNRFVAEELSAAGLGTLLVDLLTPEEEAVDARTAHLRFDIPLLARRLVDVVGWLGAHEATRALNVGLFGASTGGGAALLAAAWRPDDVAAVVSRGGRPDLAGDALEDVACPVLLVVGELDEPVLRLNRDAFERLHSKRRFDVVQGATHLFEEPGTLEEVARSAAEWFRKHLGAPEPPARRPEVDTRA